MPLTPCRRCSRHIRAHEAACPFCANSLVLGTAAALTLGASALLFACHDPQPRSVSQADVAPIAADAAPSALASTDPAPTAPPPSASSASSASPASSATAPPASSRNDPLNMMTNAAYGGPPPGVDTPGGPGLPTPAVSGDVSVAITSSTVPIADADSTVARSRAQLRRCYDVGLRNDPTMEGRVVLSVRVAPTGGVDSVTVTQNSGVSSAVAACMTAAMRRATFSAPGPTGSILTLKVACTPHTH